MKLRAGLVAESPKWQQIFRQEGFPVAVVDFDRFDSSDWSFLVINRTPADDEAGIIRSYIQTGGGALGVLGSAGRVMGIGTSNERIEYITSRRGEAFDEIRLLDIGRDCIRSREANLLPGEHGTSSVFAGRLGQGCVVDLPFDPTDLLFDDRKALRQFYDVPDRLPWEEVAFSGKGELRFLIHRIFEFLHHQRNLCYCHLAYFPEGKENLFAFRIDTDGSPEGDVRELYALATKHRIPFSWFLDVKSHEPWLSVFRSFVGHEVAVHCYEHRTYEKQRENSTNLKKAVEAMNRAGLDPEGFSAPYGQWNQGLAEAVDDMRLVYSSEFAYAFDTFPFYPVTGSRTFAALQVPIHPICIGSMLRVGYTETQMISYFHRSIQEKLARSEPLFYYHHPANGCPRVLDDLFVFVHNLGIETTTLLGFAQWWKNREKVDPEFVTKEDGVEFRSTNQTSGSSVWVEVSTPDGSVKRLPMNAGVVTRNDPGWKPIARSYPPADIRRMREFDARAQLARWFNYFLRKMR